MHRQKVIWYAIHCITENRAAQMTEKLFIYKDNKGIIIRPKCEKSKTIDVSEELGSKYLVRLQHKLKIFNI